MMKKKNINITINWDFIIQGFVLLGVAVGFNLLLGSFPALSQIKITKDQLIKQNVKRIQSANDKSYTKKIGQITRLRGTVWVKRKENSPKVKAVKNQWIHENSLVTSESRSFIQITLLDKSKLNVGPNSSLKVTSIEKDVGESSLIQVIEGKIRSKVSEDLLQNDGDHKLFIKTPTAAMGVRGTEFIVNYNKKNSVTALVTLEGSVSMAKIDRKTTPNVFLSRKIDYSDINNLLNDQDKAVVVNKGQFSGTSKKESLATLPIKVNPQQIEKLETSSLTGKLEKKIPINPKKSFRSIIPPGTTAQGFSTSISSNSQESLSVTKDIDINKRVDPRTGKIQQLPGGIIDIEGTGLYISPPPNSPYDDKTQTFTLPSNMGAINSETGNYEPPKDFVLQDDGQFIKDENSSRRSNQTRDPRKQNEPPPMDMQEIPMPGEDFQGPMNDNLFSTPDENSEEKSQNFEHQPENMPERPPEQRPPWMDPEEQGYDKEEFLDQRRREQNQQQNDYSNIIINIQYE
jgi:hypothetical protein